MRDLLIVLWFSVILNVNLAIMNLLPFPVLDGGHIVLAIGEWIRRKPLQGRILEAIQTACVLLLFGLLISSRSKTLATSSKAAARAANRAKS